MPMGIIYYANMYNPFTNSEIIIPFRADLSLLNPEHGRYMASFFSNFLSREIPAIVNIHPQDIRVPFILPITIIISFLIFAGIGYGFILFKEKKDKTDMWFWLSCYIVAFFLLFNRKTEFFELKDFVVFFEYCSSLIPYLTSFSLVIYLYTTEKTPSKAIYALLLVSTFFTGITIEQINIPYFLFISTMTLLYIYDYCKTRSNKSKAKLLKIFLYAFCINMFSCFL